MPATGEDIEILAKRVADMGSPRCSRTSLARDRLFSRLLALLRPRICHFVKRYGLTDMSEDAEQVCAIGVHRALQTFEPERSAFSTYVTWQLRGELQSLRHRVRLDQRQGARSARVRTVSLEALIAEPGVRFEPLQIVDENSLARTERTTSDKLAMRYLRRLMERAEAPPQERVIVLEALFDRDDDRPRYGKTREQRRQVVRRTFRNCAKVQRLQPNAT